MKKIAKNEIDTLIYLKDVVEAYEEIASVRMRRVKLSVLQNREFLEGVSKIYSQVKYSYRTEINKARVKTKKRDNSKVFQTRTTNGRSITVLLSVNTGLYGDIISRTFSRFIDYVKKHDTDVAIVGNVGRRYYEQAGVEGRKVYYFNLSDSDSDRVSLKTLLTHIIQYDSIVVFHGKFKDILVQEPAVSLISGDVLNESEATQAGLITDAHYIFEPSLVTVMQYFETEILSAVFEQAMFESGLSKYSSRMINLDSAVSKITENLATTKLKNRKLMHRSENKKQLTKLAGMLSRQSDTKTWRGI